MACLQKLMSENEQLIKTYNHTEQHLIDTENSLKSIQVDSIRNENQLKAKLEELSLVRIFLKFYFH